MILARQHRAFLYAASLAFGLGAWEIAAHNVSRIVVAPPSAIAVRLFEGIAAGTLAQSFLGSLAHMMLGLTIAFAVALPFGYLLGRHRVLSEFLDPVLNALYAIPPVAFVPIIVIWCGFAFEARVTLVAFMAVFEMVFAISAGARNIAPPLIDVGRSFGANRSTLVRKVMLPAMLPFVLTGLRLGFVRAIHGMIVAELFFAAVNLGALMKRDAARFDSAGVLAVVVVLALFGLATHEALKVLEWKLLPQKRA
jgi:ABC-type nitrate/sulfonate/bicarbonate transport system permease component